MPKPVIVSAALVTCPHCRGTGKAEIPPQLQQTLDVLRGLRRATAEQVGKAMKWSGTRSAMNTRLEDLRRLGLVKRDRAVRNFIYSPEPAA